VRATRRGQVAAVAIVVMAAGCAPSAGPASAGPERTKVASRPTVQVPDDVRAFRSQTLPRPVPAPKRLFIPASGVDTSLERLRRLPDGTIQVPKHWQRAGWYEAGPRPGDFGAAVILGHVDSPTGPAVFAGLNSLTRGDLIVVRRTDDSTVTFRVTRTELRRRADFPVDDVYWPTLKPELRLITCGGPYVRAHGGYLSNVIVFADLDRAH
jgi:hypothetical protein